MALPWLMLKWPVDEFSTDVSPPFLPPPLPSPPFPLNFTFNRTSSRCFQFFSSSFTHFFLPIINACLYTISKFFLKNENGFHARNIPGPCATRPAIRAASIRTGMAATKVVRSPSPVDKYPWTLWQRAIMVSTAFFTSILMSGVTVGHIGRGRATLHYSSNH